MSKGIEAGPRAIAQGLGFVTVARDIVKVRLVGL